MPSSLSPRAFLVSVVGGFGTAAFAAWNLSLIPRDYLDITKSNMLAPYAYAAALAPPTIWGIRQINKAFKLGTNRDVFIAFLGGACLFDSIAIVFASTLYGHDGPALTGSATSILHGAGALLLAELLM